ncbi:hypothetical protein AHAS_Ahas03G0145600 [Arachis hypogaea]
MYILRDHPLRHLINTPHYNLDMPYEFLLHWLHPDALFTEPIPEKDNPVEQISVSSSEPSSEEPLTASISEPTSVGQTSSTSARAFPETIEISNDEDEDHEECSDVIMISSDDDS